MKKINFKASITGRVVVITGASSGIGRAAAIEFARHGATLVLAARRQDVLTEVVAECIDLGAKAIAVTTDVTHPQAMLHLAKAAEDYAGKIDIWINNAGIGLVGEFTQTPIKAHERVIETNLLGYLHGAHAAVPYFKRQGYGVLININSLGSWIAQPYSVAYAASKFGLRGFSEALRGELKRFPGISVCDIFPGFIDTPGFQHGGNYVGRPIKPIPPVYDARRVAKAMVMLAVEPKNSVYIGASALFFKLMNFLLPGVTRSVLVTLMDFYFTRAKPIPTSDGILFKTDSTNTRIDGGWRSPHSTKKTAIIAASVFMAVAGGILLFKKNKKTGKN